MSTRLSVLSIYNILFSYDCRFEKIAVYGVGIYGEKIFRIETKYMMNLGVQDCPLDRHA